MKIFYPTIFYIIISILASCSGLQEIRHEVRDVSGNEISFRVTEYEAYVTRSGSEDGPAMESRRMFLGMAGNDSLFITATVSEMPAPKPETKAEGEAEGVTARPEHFHITAFKDDAEEPYLTLPLVTENNWESYTPMLYWPYEYEAIHFFAWSYNIGCDIIAPSYSVGEQFSAEFDYTIPSSETSENDAEVQPDLIFAITPDQRKSENPVNLNFAHALSAVEFRTGKIGDATVVNSVIQINNILSKGHCTITDPIFQDGSFSPTSIVWAPQTPIESYSQTIKGGVPFMIIPQDLTTTDAEFQIDITIGDITHEFPAKKLSELTPEWETNKKYTYTINKGGEVRVGVRDNVSGTVKNNVKIQNTGFSTSYIRAAIVGYWSVTKEDGTEEIVASWDINDAGTGTLSKASDWSSWWTMKDGFYYYKAPVAPGEYTHPLLDRYNLMKTTGPVSGSSLKINIAVQAVEQAAGEALWQDALQGNN